MEIYTYNDSAMKHLMDNLKESYRGSDRYTFILRLPFLIILSIIGVVIALILDIAASCIKA